MDITIPMQVSTFIKWKRYCENFINQCLGLILLLILGVILCVSVSIIGWMLASGLCYIIGEPMAWYMKDIPSSPITVIFIIVLNCVVFIYYVIKMGILSFNIHFLPDEESPKKKSLL